MKSQTSQIFWQLVKIISKKARIGVGSIIIIALCGPFLYTGTTYNDVKPASTPTPSHVPTLTSKSQKTQHGASLLASTPTPFISITTSSSPDYISDSIQTVYVLLTLVIATATIWSVRVNRKQSQTALETSDRQSQAAINAIHEQIEESKRQAQESINNQNKPVLVCAYLPDIKGYTTVDLMIENVGVGVGTNIWGFLTYDRSKTRDYEQYHFVQSAVLAAGKERILHFVRRENSDKLKEIEGYSFFPQNNGDVIYNMRLTMTYHDVFDHKHLSIFDFSEMFGWKQIALKNIEKLTLEEFIRNEGESL